MKKGRIIKIISNQYTVDTGEQIIDCLPRGKFRNQKISPVVGDYVEINPEEKVIEKILERKNYLDRPVVANIDIALIVTSLKKPDLSLTLLDKLLSIVKIKNIEPVICFTKLDLLSKEEKKNYLVLKKEYEQIGYQVLTNQDLRKIKKLIKGKIAVVTGQTGAGKSSLLNRLDQSLNLETNPISEALNRGVHTTRYAAFYKIAQGYIVDTPGFSALDFANITPEILQSSFLEFNRYRCGFTNCTHDKENKCLVKEAVNNGKIMMTRYQNYLKFLGEVYENNRKLFK